MRDTKLTWYDHLRRVVLLVVLPGIMALSGLILATGLSGVRTESDGGLTQIGASGFVQVIAGLFALIAGVVFWRVWKHPFEFFHPYGKMSGSFTAAVGKDLKNAFGGKDEPPPQGT